MTQPQPDLLTSLGGVRVPSTSNRQRMFRSGETPFPFSMFPVVCFSVPHSSGGRRMEDGAALFNADSQPSRTVRTLAETRAAATCGTCPPASQSERAKTRYVTKEGGAKERAR